MLGSQDPRQLVPSCNWHSVESIAPLPLGQGEPASRLLISVANVASGTRARTSLSVDSASSTKNRPVINLSQFDRKKSHFHFQFFDYIRGRCAFKICIFPLLLAPLYTQNEEPGKAYFKCH